MGVVCSGGVGCVMGVGWSGGVGCVMNCVCSMHY